MSLIRSITLITLLCVSQIGRSDAPADKSLSAADVINRSISALGGRDRILSIMKSYIRTRAKVDRDSVDMHQWSDGLDRHKSLGILETAGRTIRITRVRNGDTIWQRINDGELSTQEGAQDNAGLSSDMQRLARLLFPLVELDDFHLELRGERDIAGHTVYLVKAKSKEYPDLDLFFDKNTALLFKYAYRGSAGVWKDKNVEHFFSAYRDFNGMKYATKSTMKLDGVLFSEDEVVELRLLKEFPKGTFDRP